MLLSGLFRGVASKWSKNPLLKAEVLNRQWKSQNFQKISALQDAMQPDESAMGVYGALHGYEREVMLRVGANLSHDSHHLRLHSCSPFPDSPKIIDIHESSFELKNTLKWLNTNTYDLNSRSHCGRIATMVIFDRDNVHPLQFYRSSEVLLENPVNLSIDFLDKHWPLLTQEFDDDNTPTT